MTRLQTPEWMDAEGLSLINKYKNYDENTPLDVYKRLAKKAASYLGDAFYEPLLDCFYNGWLSPATPVATNYGAYEKDSSAPRGLPVSCFGLMPQNSIDGIFKAANEAAMLSKNGGGLGINLSDLVGISPVTAWAKLYDLTAKIVSQGGIRRGAVALYLDVEHPDIEAFLQAKNMLAGDPREKLDCNIAVILPDSFFDRLKDKDPQTIKLFAKILELRMTQGSPYLFFIDNANRQKGVDYESLGLDINTSQLCNEITLYCDEKHTFICVLSSLVLSRWDEFKDVIYTIDDYDWDVVGLSVAFLDAVTQEFIDLGENVSMLENAVRFAHKSRALGLGVLGWHSLLQAKNIAFGSKESRKLNKEIFSKIHTNAVKASKKLADMFYYPAWCEASKQRNSHILAIAPTLASSVLSSGGSPGVEPIQSNVYMYVGANGNFLRKNPNLQKTLKEFNLDTKEIWDLISANNGSVKCLKSILSQYLPEHKLNHFLNVFKTAYEINQSDIIELAAERQSSICQGQSINVFIPHDEDAQVIANLHIKAWKLGLKGLYYLRSTSPRTKAITLEEDKTVSTWHLDTVEGCVYCDKAKALLKQHNIQYTEHEVKELIPGNTYPQIYLNCNLIGGYTELEKYFESNLPVFNDISNQGEVCIIEDVEACMSCSG